MILEGRVVVNGHVVRELGTRADPRHDRIAVDGKPLPPKTGVPVVVMLHKPRNVMTTRSDPEGRRTVMDLLPAPLRRLRPVGRLDFDTSGVLLLSDDGDLINQLTHPTHGVVKVYEARVRGNVSDSEVRLLSRGVVLHDEAPSPGQRPTPGQRPPSGQRPSSSQRPPGGRRPARVDAVRTAPCKARVLLRTENNTVVEIRLREGRQRQVRRMMQAIGHPVSALRRVRFAGLGLEGMKPGEHRRLLPGEVKLLLRRVEKTAQRTALKQIARAEAETPAPPPRGGPPHAPVHPPAPHPPTPHPLAKKIAKKWTD